MHNTLYAAKPQGFENTFLHDRVFRMTEYGQQQAPHNLAAVPPVNRNFAETNADLAPHPGWNTVVGSFPAHRPLWAEPRYLAKHAELAYHYGSLAMNQIEDMTMYTGRGSTAAPARANIFPTQKPVSQFQPIIN